jgi:hypothetical protein
MDKSEQYINYTYLFLLSSSQNQLSIKLSADIHNGQQLSTLYPFFCPINAK